MLATDSTIGVFPTARGYESERKARVHAVKHRIVGNFPTMQALANEFDAVASAMDNLPASASDEVVEPMNDLLWAIRETIQDTPARTPSDFQIKAGAYRKQVVREEGQDFDCPGSARKLAESLIDDALAIMG